MLNIRDLKIDIYKSEEHGLTIEMIIEPLKLHQGYVESIMEKVRGKANNSANELNIFSIK